MNNKLSIIVITYKYIYFLHVPIDYVKKKLNAKRI